MLIKAETFGGGDSKAVNEIQRTQVKKEGVVLVAIFFSFKYNMISDSTS